MPLFTRLRRFASSSVLLPTLLALFTMAFVPAAWAGDSCVSLSSAPLSSQATYSFTAGEIITYTCSGACIIQLNGSLVGNYQAGVNQFLVSTTGRTYTFSWNNPAPTASCALPSTPGVRYLSAVSTARSSQRQPSAVAVDSVGNRYFVNMQNGTAIKQTLQSSGTFVDSTIATGLGQPTSIAVDSSQNVYTTSLGTDIVELTHNPDNSYTQSTVVAGVNPGQVALNVTSPIIYATKGTTIVAYATRTGLLQFTINAPNGVSPIALATDATNNIYFTASDGNVYLATAIASYAVTQLPIAAFTNPTGILLQGNSGSMYISDGTTNTITNETLTSSTYTPTTIVASAASGGLTSPRGMAFTPNGDILVADLQANRIARVSLNGAVDFGGIDLGSTSNNAFISFQVNPSTTIGAINTFTQGISGLDFIPFSGNGICAPGTYSISTTCAVAVSFKPAAAGTRMGAIQILNGATTPVTLASVPMTGIGNGAQITYPLATAASTTFNLTGLQMSNGVAIDPAGNTYVSVRGGQGVYKLAPGCTTLTCATPVGGGYVFASALALDGDGTLYVADYNLPGIIKVPQGCTTQACVTVMPGSVTQPFGLATDGKGTLYIGDTDAHTVRTMPTNCSTANCTTVIGGGFSSLYQVAVDANGNVYVADAAYNNAIKEIPYGCTSAACTLTLGGGFNGPVAVAVDPAGNVYVGDTNTQTYKKMPPNCFSASCVTQIGVIKALGNGNVYPGFMAFDGAGNLYTASYSSNSVSITALATPPTLRFAPTNIGSTSTDSPQTTSITNSGTTAMSFYIAAAGSTNPVIVGSGFSLDPSTTCPISLPTTITTLATGSTCSYAINFKPTATTNTATLNITGTFTGSSNTTQKINLSGTGMVGLTGFTITSLPATLVAGTQAAITVTANTTGGGTLTGYVGTVHFSATDVQAGLPTDYQFQASDNGVHSFYLNLYTAGSQTVTVADTVTTTVTGTATTTVTAAAGVNVGPIGVVGQSAAIGQAFAQPLTALVSDVYNNPASGVTVTFRAPLTGTSAIITPTTCITGTAGSCSVSATANATAGTYTVGISVPGGVAGIGVTLTNSKASPTFTTTTTPGSSVYGTAISIKATSSLPSVTAGGVTSTPTGAVTFQDGSTVLTTGAPSNGSATYSFIPTAGAHTFGASMAADNNFNAIALTTATPITISQASSTLAGPSASPFQVNVGTSGPVPVTLTGQYTGTGITTPSGSVSWTLTATGFTTVNGTATITAGAASIALPLTVPPGTYNLATSYAGDTNYNAATTINNAIQVGKLTPTVTYPAQAAITYNAALTNNLNATTAFSTTSLTAGGTTTYTATLGAGSPVAVTTATVLTPGTYTLTALWTPNSTNLPTYNTATGSTTLIVNKAASATAITHVTPLPVNGGAGVSVPVTYSVAVSSAAGTPTGTVQFYNGSTAIGSAVTLVAGAASFTTTFATVQTAVITAQYVGDSNFAGSTSTSITEPIVVANLIITANPSTLTVTRGTPGTAVITFTPVGNYTGSAALSCSGMPFNSACNFTTSSVSFAGNNAVQTATLTVLTVAPYTSGTRPAAMSFLASLSLGLLLFVRRRKLAPAVRSLLLLLIAATASLGITGCGSAGSAGTPVGTTPLTVTVTATGTATGSASSTQTVNITLVVQ